MASLQDTRGNIMRLQLAQQSMEGDLAGKLKNLDLLNNQLKVQFYFKVVNTCVYPCICLYTKFYAAKINNYNF